MNKSVVGESVIAQLQNSIEVGKFIMKDSEDCAKDDDNEEDGPVNVCAFRKIPRAIKEGLKRLQDGPKKSRREAELRRMTGIVMQRLIENLAKEIPEMMIREVTRKKKKIKMKSDNEITGRAPDQEEDCLMLLGGLTLNKGKEEGQ